MENYIRLIGEKAFYVEQHESVGDMLTTTIKKKEIVTEILGNELDTLKRALKKREGMETKVAHVPCWNPDCDNMVILPKSQKRDFTVRFLKNYEKIMLPFCCNECREAFIQCMKQKEVIIQ